MGNPPVVLLSTEHVSGGPPSVYSPSRIICVSFVRIKHLFNRLFPGWPLLVDRAYFGSNMSFSFLCFLFCVSFLMTKTIFLFTLLEVLHQLSFLYRARTGWPPIIFFIEWFLLFLASESNRVSCESYSGMAQRWSFCMGHAQS